MRIGFILSEVARGLRRNLTMTIAMVLTTGISLAMFGGGLLAVQMADNTKAVFLDRIEIQIFLTKEQTEQDPNCTQMIPGENGGPEQPGLCRKLQADLEAFPGVQSVVFLDKAKAEADLRRADPKLAEMASSVIELPVSFKVKVPDPNRFQAVIDEFQHKPGVGSVKNQRDLVEGLLSMFNGLRDAAFAIALVQAIAALLLIANMVQIAAYTRRDEVAIMRLVGATRWYTQLPFLLEAMLASFAGFLLSIAALFAAKPTVIDVALGDLYKTNVLAPPSSWDIVLIAPYLAIGGVGFAAITAYVTLRLYVRK